MPQETPSGTRETVPLPSPIRATVSANRLSANVAVTVTGASRVTWHGPFPVQPAPDHPVKVEPAAALGVSRTSVPSSNRAEQVPPHEIRTGELVTVPDPLLAFKTLGVCLRIGSKSP